MKKFWSYGSRGRIMTYLQILIVISAVTSRVSAERRQPRLIPASPTPGALKEIAEAIGAATYEELPDVSPTGLQKPFNSIDKEQIEDKSIEYQTYQGVVGRPSIDFPVFPSIPQTYFECKQRPTGYYADLETDCQVFHICDGGRKISFLCPNGTIFHQSKLICDWWFKVDCLQSPEQYEESAEHLAEDQRKAEKTKIVTQALNTAPVISRRSDGNFVTRFTQGDNHVSEYTAEASFNSVTKSHVSSPNSSPQTYFNRVSQTPRSFQRRPEVKQQTTESKDDTRNDTPIEENHRRRTTSNNYNYASTRRSIPDYTDAAVYRTTTPAPKDFRDSKESQVLAETASFASGRSINNYYYSSNVDNRPKTTPVPLQVFTQTPSRTTRPAYTTTYTPGTKTYVEVSRSVSKTVTASPISYYTTAPVSYRVAATVSSELKNNDNRILNHRLDAPSSPTSYTPVKTNFKTNQQHYKEKRVGKNQETQRSSIGSNNDEVKFKNHRYDTTTERLPFYAPSIPTIAPKIYNASTNKFLATNWYSVSDIETTPSTIEVSSLSNRIAEPAVAEHAAEMIKTLEELDVDTPNSSQEGENSSGRRPGLFVPPSAGPNTLHSLAIYFATAVDNFASTPYPSTESEQEIPTTEQSIKEDETFTELLTRNTVHGYNTLFKKQERKNKQLRDDDLDSAHSTGLLASSPQIRELAQVFTHALSAYLQDPETFRKILAEIRPTEPTSIEDSYYTTPSTPYIPLQQSTQSTDYFVNTKEEDEVLDFSDVSKGSSYPTTLPIETTTNSVIGETKAFNIDLLRNKLLLSPEIYRSHRPQFNTHSQNKSPASDLVTHQDEIVDNKENDIRQGKSFSTIAPSTSNNVALEINGGLSDPNNQVESRFGDSAYNVSNDDSYFPLYNSQLNTSQYDNTHNDSLRNFSPYGEGVRPNISKPFDTTYYTSPNPTETIPTQWGNLDSTRVSTNYFNPEIPSFDLIPPSNTYDKQQQSVTDDYLEHNTESFTTTTTTENPELESIKKERNNLKYKSHSADRALYYNNRFKLSNDNDEQLQRAHSQSFVSSANQLGRKSKKIENQNKFDDNNENANEKTTFDKTYAIKTSTGEIVSLPTLKDILSVPTSTAPTQDFKSERQTTVFPSVSTTIVTTQKDIPKEPSTTAQIETTTINDFSKSTTKSQSSTSQYNIWSTSAALGHLWETTVYLDPLTINNELTSDGDSETIIPSANTYGVGDINNNSNEHKIETTITPQTLQTQETGASQYNSFTTPFRINVEEFTTTPPPPPLTDYTNYPLETVTEEILQQSQTAYISNGHQDVSRITDSSNYYSNEREGKSLSTVEPRFAAENMNSTVDVDQTMMIKAKEMFGGLNDSSADTLMNVMKSADKNKTVRRLILLLIQTCDDDHNKTLEASRTALLDALMKIPAESPEIQETIVPPTENLNSLSKSTDVDNLQDVYNRRSDEIIETQDTKFSDLYKSERSGKSLNYDSTTPSSTTSTTQEITTVTKIEEPTSTTTATPSSIYTTETYSTKYNIPEVSATLSSKRNGRKYYAKSAKIPLNSKTSENTSAFNSGEKQSVSSFDDHSVPSDTRALELLRSLYSLAARWG